MRRRWRPWPLIDRCDDCRSWSRIPSRRASSATSATTNPLTSVPATTSAGPGHPPHQLTAGESPDARNRCIVSIGDCERVGGKSATPTAVLAKAEALSLAVALIAQIPLAIPVTRPAPFTEASRRCRLSRCSPEKLEDRLGRMRWQTTGSLNLPLACASSLAKKGDSDEQ